MTFKLKGWYKKHQQEQYEKQYIIMPYGSEKHVTDFEDKSINYDTYKDMRMNSYAQDLFFSKMDDDSLIERAEYFISQCGRYIYPAATYNDALIHVVVPELMKRLKVKL